MAKGEPLFTVEQLYAMKDSELLFPKEVAAIFRVDPKTVTRWAAAGKIEPFRTIGGHRRFRVGVVKQAYEAGLTETV